MKYPENLCSNCIKTKPHTCGYLDNEKAIIHFMPLDQINDKKHFTLLNEKGYRRSGGYIYHPACTDCQKCIPVRIPVSTFSPSRSQKRLWKKNQDITVSEVNPEFNEERYLLYERYINNRHLDGEMYPPSKEQFSHFLCEGSHWSRFFELRLSSGKLIAVTVADLMQDSLALLYTFFDPDHEDKSLGSYSILWIIEYARQHHMSSVYLGYWIEECRKMNYKTRFNPHEILADGHWQSHK